MHTMIVRWLALILLPTIALACPVENAGEGEGEGEGEELLDVLVECSPQVTCDGEIVYGGTTVTHCASENEAQRFACDDGPSTCESGSPPVCEANCEFLESCSAFRHVWDCTIRLQCDGVTRSTETSQQCGFDFRYFEIFEAAGEEAECDIFECSAGEAGLCLGECIETEEYCAAE
jgi:hypothetical protein